MSVKSGTKGPPRPISGILWIEDTRSVEQNFEPGSLFWISHECGEITGYPFPAAASHQHSNQLPLCQQSMSPQQRVPSCLVEQGLCLVIEGFGSMRHRS